MPTLPAQTPLICGPTAGGKSALAVDLALALRERYNMRAEVVTADAFQVYKGLNIGTAKPASDEQRGVPHHLIDIVNPTSGALSVSAAGSSQALSDTPSYTPFTVNRWLDLAERTIADLRRRDVLPIVVGGTHLYVKALLDGLFQGSEPDPELRATLNAMDPGARRAELERVDPQAASRIHPNDIRRTVRALEVFRQTGAPISDLQTQWDHQDPSRREGAGVWVASDPSPLYDERALGDHTPRAPARGAYLLVALDWTSELINPRINARVKSMIERGLVDEARTLYANHALGPQAREALGYKQLIEHFDSHRTLDDAIEQIKIETRRFAKNQRTWLRRLRSTSGAVRIDAASEPVEAWPQIILDALWGSR